MIGLLSVVLLHGCRKPDNSPSISVSQEGKICGIDVSHHNGKIDWKTIVEKDKMQFVFIKATEGATFKDSHYKANITGARNAGLKVGAYHFLTTSSSAESQFNNFKKTVNVKDIDLIPVLDAENITKGYPIAKEEYAKLVRKWVDLCTKHYGKAPIIYSSIGFYQKYLKGHVDDCLFWTGDVYATRSYINKEPWVIWQKSINKCEGASSRLDINILSPGSTLSSISLSDECEAEGIDVSHHQGEIDWKKVMKAQPKLAFVYVKCTEGKSYVDPKFKVNAEGAAAVGYKVGAYHYFRMTSSAHEQFDIFKKQMDAVHIDLIPMVDVERDDGKPRKELQDSLKVLLDLLENAYGKKPIIYGTNRSYNEFCAPKFNHYPLYIGKYSYSKPVVIGPSHYTIWQFSETGSINGFAGGVDLCRFHPDKSVDDIIL